jgi:hypothetical protein
LPIQPVSAAVRKPLGTTMPFAIIPQGHEKCGLAGLPDERRGGGIDLRCRQIEGTLSSLWR